MLKAKFIGVSFAALLILSFSIKAEAGIVLKLMAVNPSKEQTQTVQIKAYLPKEIKPEDVLDKGDLNVIYDTQQGSYYVYGDYELKPGETLEKNIELRDIWNIPEADIEAMRNEAVKLRDILKNTEFKDRISFLSGGIDDKLDQILESQRNSPANPERHISNYRDNNKALESVKADLVLARSLLSQVKTIPPVTVWNMIIAIIIFLGVIGIVFYLIWQRQVKLILKEGGLSVKKDSADVQLKPAEHKGSKEADTELPDIENIIEKKG